MKLSPHIILAPLLAMTLFGQATPRIIRFSGQVEQSTPQTQPVTISFAFFADQTGGSPLWNETQQTNIKDGKFTVLLGSTQPDGLPVSLFSSGEARWIEWQFNGQAPSPRTQLISVPYAMSAASAETLAGHSLSEFVLTQPESKDHEASRAQREGEPVGAGNGIPNMLAKFSGTSSTTTSQVFDDGSSVGIGTLAPSAKLEVAGDLKISGNGNALIFPDGTRFSANSAGINAKSIEQVRYADQFADGSQTGGIAEAYADCPPTGCKIQLGQDVNITSPQILTVAIGKPLVLDLAGRTLQVSNITGIGLTFTSENINTRTPMSVTNGTLKCSWIKPGLTGFAWVSSVNVSIEKMDVRDCNTPGSVAVLWDFVEDSHMNAVGFRFNSGALRVQNASNQVGFRNVWFDGNVDPIVFQDNSGMTLEDCLVQSNTGPRAVQIITSSGNNATTFRVHKCHFENNGDGSAASRNIYVAPAASQVILGISIEDNVFTAGSSGGLGTSFEIAGSQTVMPVTFKNNQYNGYQRGKITAGVRSGSRVTAIAENLGQGDSSYDVGINTHGLPGLSFAPEGAARSFQIFAGWPGNYDGFLQFWDSTTNSSLLSYSANASSWTFAKTAVFDSAVVLNNSQNISGYSDRQAKQTWGVTSSDGAARFDGGVSVGSNGLKINGAAALTTSAQTGTGSIVLSQGATLTDPNLGDATATSLTMNGETMTATPMLVYSATVMNPTAVGLHSRLTLDKPITVTRLQFVLNNGTNSGCTTAAVLQVADGVSQISLPLENDVIVFDSGAVSVRFPSGAPLDIRISTAAAGCLTSAVSGNATVQYRMQ